MSGIPLSGTQRPSKRSGMRCPGSPRRPRLCSTVFTSSFARTRDQIRSRSRRRSCGHVKAMNRARL